ncbi:MAG: hypothetical protein ACXVBE_04160 [Bdellovibrionota bacterium]
MTISKQVLTVLLFPALFSAPAHAHEYGYHHWWHQPRCDSPETTSTVLESHIQAITSECKAVPLRLTRMAWQDQTVDGWTGGYERSVTMHTTYRLDHFDHCSGSFLWAETKEGVVPEILNFNVSNPNLDPNLPSYAANAPLTDAEAAAELPAALEVCQKVQAGQEKR